MRRNGVVMKTRSIWFLTVAHASADINQGAIPVLLPFFIAAHHLSYTAAAAIVFGVNIVSTVFQPIFGYMSDRWSKPWLIPLSMVVIGLGVSFAGFAPTYRIGVASVMVSGLGIAAFHPEGARLMNYLAGDKKATAMSLFGIGGQLGFAVGPLIATAALFWWGIKGTACLIVPPAVMAGLFFCMLPRLTAGYEPKAVARSGETDPEGQRPLACVYLSCHCPAQPFGDVLRAQYVPAPFLDPCVAPVKGAWGFGAHRLTCCIDSGKLSGRKERGPCGLTCGDRYQFSPPFSFSSPSARYLEPAGRDTASRAHRAAAFGAVRPHGCTRAILPSTQGGSRLGNHPGPRLLLWRTDNPSPRMDRRLPRTSCGDRRRGFHAHAVCGPVSYATRAKK